MELSALDLSDASETGFEFEYVPESTGIGEGLFITVLGKHEGTVKDWTRKEINRMRTRDAMLGKKGRDEIRTIEEDEAFNIQSAAVRIVGWRGLTQAGEDVPFSKETAVKICTINAEIRDQVGTASELMSNFTKAQ